MDSDIDNEEAEKDVMEKLGIKVFSWDKGNAIEEQIFQDATIQCAEQLIAYAVELKGIQSVEALLNNEFSGEPKEYKVDNGAIVLCGNDKGEVSKEFLRRIGKVAKGKFNKKKNDYEGCWFKRIDRGQEIGRILFSSKEQIYAGSTFGKIMSGMLKWVNSNEG